MIDYPRTIRDFVGFVDGVGYAGRGLEAKMPELKLILANHRGGGMDGTKAMDKGMEPMQSEMTFADWPPELITKFGTYQRLTLRPGARGEDDFTADSYVTSIGGLMTAVNFGDLKPGTDVPLKLNFEVDYFRMVHNEVELFEIDIRAYKRVIGGVDQLAETRRAMGL